MGKGTEYAQVTIHQICGLLEYHPEDPIHFGTNDLDENEWYISGPAQKSGALGALIIFGYVHEQTEPGGQITYSATRQSILQLRNKLAEWERKHPAKT